jgi:hypothetical protein
MSFFDFMSRMVEGKPVFEEENKNPVLKEADMANEPQPAVDKGNDRTFPVVYVKRLKTNLNGRNMDLYAQIVNSWTDEVMLDKIRIGDSIREIDDFLKSNEEREFLIYSGPKLSKECFGALLDYKTKEDGDYFEAVHDVKCTYDQTDSTYTLSEMRLHLPIRDIYG